VAVSAPSAARRARVAKSRGEQVEMPGKKAPAPRAKKTAGEPKKRAKKAEDKGDE